MISIESARARLAELALAKDKAVAGLHVEWSVTYAAREHEMRIAYDLRADGADMSLAHLWVANLVVRGAGASDETQHITNVVEFDLRAQVRGHKGVLIDGKWRREDKGRRFRAAVSGYCLIGDAGHDFFYSHDYDFPGW